MNRALYLVAMLVALALFVAVPCWRVPTALAADHREAPIVDGIPEGDITDVYLFTDPNDSSRVVFIMNVNPFSVPAEASSYSLSPDLLYQFKIDNTGDAREDLVLQVVADIRGTGQTIRVFGPSRPSNTGARNTLLRGDPAVKGAFGQVIQSTDGAIKAFVGLRDDPFVFDIGQFFRILNNTQDVFRAIPSAGFRGRAVRADGTSGVDGFGGFDVTTIAVSVPKSMVRGQKSKINVWATVSQHVSGGEPGFAKSEGRGKGDHDDDEDDDAPRPHYQQFERMGQQVFATVFIPKGTPRDAENAEIPEHDMANYSGLIPDALTDTDASVVDPALKNTIQNRANLLTALGLTGLPNGAPLLITGNFVNKDKHLLRAALLPDVLRFDLDVPGTEQDIGQFGLQNGRRLQDPSVDIAVQLLRSLADVHFPAGVPGGGSPIGRVALECSAFPACQDRRVLVVVQGTTFNKPDAQLNDFTVVGNDRPFSNTFPYVGTPHPLPGEPGTVGFPPQQ